MRDLRQGLKDRQQKHLYRSRRVVESPQGSLMKIDGKNVVSFCSNDYLGLANHPKVIAAFKRAANEFGVGSGAAHLINGHSHYHHKLEEALADFVGTERALLFSTGYMANIGVVQALVGRGDAIFADRLNHASLIDGARLSGAKLHRYPHGDIATLEHSLSHQNARKRLLMTDGVFSMDGDVAPLPKLMTAAVNHDAWLLVDDAHGLGTLGSKGKGSLEVFAIEQTERLILMGTLGKAFGTSGAFVAGTETLIEHLIQTARSYIYTTAIPPATAAATLASLAIIQAEPERRTRLAELVRYFRDCAASQGLELMASQTAIQGVICGNNQKVVSLSQSLWEKGFLVTAIRPPTVPDGSARLRLTISSEHDKSQIDKLVSALSK